MKRTQLLQHLVTFIQYKVFDIFEVQSLVANEGKDPPWCSYDNVRAALLQYILILLYGQATEEDGTLNVGHVLGEALVLFTDLEGQFTCVAHNQHRNLQRRQ